MTERPRLFWLTLLSCSFLEAAPSSQMVPTIRGTVVAISPREQRLVVRVPVPDGDPLERTFYVDDFTRVSRSGQAVPFATIPSSAAVEVTFDRRDGRNLARIIDVSPPVPAPEAAEVSDSIDSLEERERYEEQQASTLDILEEEIEELTHASEIRSHQELARSRAWSDRLNRILSDARDRLDSLVSTREEAAWARARSELVDALGELRTELARARAEITGR